MVVLYVAEKFYLKIGLSLGSLLKNSVRKFIKVYIVILIKNIKIVDLRLKLSVKIMVYFYNQSRITYRDKVALFVDLLKENY